MNSEDVTLKGKVSWVRMFQPNQFNKWSLTLHPDAESLKKFSLLQKEGVKNQLKIDDDGTHLQISRPTFVELRKGVKTQVSLPTLTHADGRSMEGVRVGDGSSGTVTVEVYSHPIPDSQK